MKLLIILASIAAVTVAQRPTYAGLSSKGYPELASRFRDPADDQNVNVPNNTGVVNRLGTDDDLAPANLPTDARGDAVLVDRLNQWPRENRPFWLINAEHIEKHRRPGDTTNQDQQNLNTIQQGTQQRLNEIRPNLDRNQILNQEGPVTFNQLDRSRNQQAIQSRFGEPVGTETRTIKPLSQRGSFAGERTF